MTLQCSETDRHSEPWRARIADLACNAPAASLAFDETYRFFDVGVRLRTDSRRLLGVINNLYRRFRCRATGTESDLLVWTKGAAPPSRLGIHDRDHRYLVFKTNQGLLLRGVDVRSGTMEILSFDGEGVHRVSASEKGLAIEGERSEEDEVHLLAFVQMFFLRTVGSLLADRHLLHAASLAINGGGIILPGASGRGKTMLTLALVKHGFRFLSDDVACLDLVNKQVEPFPRGINLCHSGLAMLTALVGHARVGAALAEGRWDIDDLFPGSAGEARPLRWVVLLQGFGSRPRLVPISKRRALWQALRLSHTPITRPAHALWCLSPLMEQADCYELTAGEPETTADVLRRLAEGDTDELW